MNWTIRKIADSRWQVGSEIRRLQAEQEDDV